MGKPKIRFKGYNDEWEQRKLGELTEELSDYTTMASGLPLLTSSRNGLIYQSDFRDKKTTTSDETLFSIVPEGACTYRHMSDDDIFHLNINALEKGLVSREYPVFIASEHNNLEFVIQHINSSDRFRAFCKGQKKGGTRTRLYYKTLREFEIMVPVIEEQNKISASLHNFDNIITLHQRKCDEMKTLKKYMLQKMFPQNGQKIPEIRFEGFTDEWEQRKCKDIFDRVAKSVDVEAGEIYREIGIRSHGKGLFYKDEITGEELGNKRVFWVEPDCFILNIVFAWERAVAKTTEKELGMIASHRFPMYKPKENVTDLDYITKFFITHKGKYILEMASPGGAGRNKTLGQKEFENSTICLPSYEEQKKIGSYLEALDRLITLHQRKCDELKNIKKFMLQNMFV